MSFRVATSALRPYCDFTRAGEVSLEDMGKICWNRVITKQKQSSGVGVTKPTFFPFNYLPCMFAVQNYRSTDNLQNITLLFDRYHHSCAADAPDKYERDLKYLTYASTELKFPITNRALVTHTHVM